jgi:transcriptional regulator with XRE-family HTH domain
MISEQVGKKIREYRKKAGLSLESLALSAEITPNFLGDVERGVKKPSIDTLESILAVLGITLSDFFSFDAEIQSDDERLELKKVISSLRRLSDDELKTINNIIKQVKHYGNINKHQ